MNLNFLLLFLKHFYIFACFLIKTIIIVKYAGGDLKSTWLLDKIINIKNFLNLRSKKETIVINSISIKLSLFIILSSRYIFSYYVMITTCGFFHYCNYMYT